MKRKLILLLALLVGCFQPITAAAENITVYLDGDSLDFDVPPQIINDRTMVPMRVIFEALGYTVNWEGETKTVTAERPRSRVEMTVGKNTLVKDGIDVSIDVAPVIVDGRTLVPLRALGEASGKTVDWDGNTRTVYLGTGQQNAETAELVSEVWHETVGEIQFSIPKINLSGEDVERINQEIWKVLYEDVLPTAREAWAEYEIYGNPTKYVYAVNGSVLSLVIAYGRHPALDFDEYLIYNVDMTSGKQLSDSEFLALAGFTPETYILQAKKALGSGLWEIIDHYPEGLTDEGFVVLFNDRLEKTLAEENIRNSSPYLNDEGTLCAAVCIYSMAGGDYYWQLVNLESFELKPNYDQPAALQEK